MTLLQLFNACKKITLNASGYSYASVSCDVNDDGITQFKAYTQKTSWITTNSPENLLEIVKKSFSYESKPVDIELSEEEIEAKLDPTFPSCSSDVYNNGTECKHEQLSKEDTDLFF